ncbi:hypothetical protein [Anaerorhabdus furcosa]|uniref:Uncharacterized protein n=1 Tax=Anaerorhabdus furcosa TaxID=118967 RepID=A0A1T4M181_9FIRM|nr:hypothetical protein [Anaerorhabdus furcosa]SJZ60749.1 hypothetical protein SAMN02745191_1140 [Anaerorhabdus furcosa]
MPLPRKEVKIYHNKNGTVHIESSLNRADYLMRELICQALYEVQRLLIKRLRERTKKEFKNIPSDGSKSRLKSSWQYWQRKIENDLQIGTKADTYYANRQEKGFNQVLPAKGYTRNTKRGVQNVKAYSKRNMTKQRDILSDTVDENYRNIVKIISTYISAVEDEARASGLIGGDENDNE